VRVVAAGALITLAALIQVTWAPAVTVAGAFPNLVLLVVIGATWLGGVRAGMTWACAGGVVLDLTAPGPLGPHALALLVGAYVAGFWIRNLERESFIQPALAAACATVIYCLALLVADDRLGLPMPSPASALGLIGAATAYNTLTMPLAMLALRRLRPVLGLAARAA
jgi:rod shape-determining protein MreD